MQLKTRRATLLATLAVAALAAVLPNVASARTAYLVDESARQVDVIDLASGLQSAPPIPTGKDPRELAISADGGRAYVVNVESNTVTAIDARTNTVLGNPIPVGKGPIRLALAPDGRRLYVEDLFAHDISVIDTASDTVVATLPTAAHSMAISADGSLLYVGTGSNQVITYSTASNLPVGNPIPVGESPEALAFTPDGSRLFVAGRSGTLQVFDVASRTQIGPTIPIGELPESLAITPDGRRLYIGHNLTASVQVLDTTTDTLIGGPIATGKGPYTLAMAPDGRHVYTGTQSGLQAIDTTTGAVSTFKMSTVLTGLAIVPDQGPHAALTASLSGTTATLDAAASSDPDGGIASYAWDFGDGKSAVTASPTVTHSYPAGASYSPRVTPIDAEGCGATRVGSGQIAYCNPSPEPSATASISVPAPARGAGPAPAPSAPVARRRAVLHLGKLTLDPGTGTAALRVRVAEPGRLGASGKGIAPRTLRARHAGAFTVRIATRGSARRALLARGHLTVKVRFAFRSNGLLPTATSRSIGLIDRAVRPGGA